MFLRSWQAPGLTQNFQTNLKILDKLKHSSLFRFFVRDEIKSFITEKADVDVIKLFSFVRDGGAKRGHNLAIHKYWIRLKILDGNKHSSLF